MSNLFKTIWLIWLAAALSFFPLSAYAQNDSRASAQALTSTLNSAITVDLFAEQTVLAYNVTGLTASGATLTIEGSTDARNTTDSAKVWVATNGYALPGGSTTGFTTLNTDQSFRVDTAGFTNIRIRVSTGGSGTILVGYNGISSASLAAASSGGGGGGAITAPLDAAGYVLTNTTPLIVVGSTITRPADTTAYAFGDLWANSTTAGSVTPGTLTLARANDQAGLILSCGITISGTVITNGQLRLHFYSSLPTVTNGDNGAWLSPKAGYLGAMDVTLDRVFSDGAYGAGGPIAGASIAFKPATGTQTVYYLPELRAGFTPTSAETLTPTCQVQ